MNELLQFMIQHYSFLWNDLGATFVDSQLRGGDALLILEQGDLRIRFVRDRAQLFLEFQSRFRRPAEEWFSLEVLRYFLTGVASDNEVIDGAEAAFLRDNIGRIGEAFSRSRHKVTEKTLHEYKKTRSQRIFG